MRTVTLILATCLSNVWAEPTTIRNSLGMSFRLLPPGSFTAGPPELTPEDAPWQTGNPTAGKKATIPKGIYFGIHEVRVRDYKAFLNATKHAEPEGELYSPLTKKWTPALKPLEEDAWSSPNLPVTCVSYDDAVAFCKWLSAKEGRTYRLPTEIEWEYAARAGSDLPFQLSDKLDPTQINGALANDTVIRANPGDADADAEEGFESADEQDDTGLALLPGDSASHSRRTQYPPNKWGLFHMLGNVQEFVTMTHQPPESDIPFPGWTELPGKVNRMLRGGSFIHDNRDCTVYQANFNCPPYSNCTIGFRVVMERKP